MNSRLAPSLPTRGADWRLMGRTVRLVLTIPTYALVAVVAAALGLSVFVLTRNTSLLVDVILFGSLPMGSRLSILINLYPFVGTGYTVGTAILLVVAAALVGVDVAMVVYHLREHDLSVRQGSGGVTGVVLGTIGAGCASCGSVVLAGVLSLFGANGALALLPLEGQEFLLVALVGIVLSIYWIAEGLRGGRIRGCPVDA